LAACTGITEIHPRYWKPWNL